MAIQKDSMEAYHRAAQNHEHVQSIEYLRSHGLQLKQLAVMRDVDRLALRLGGLFAYPRKTVIEDNQHDSPIKALAARGAGYLAATKFAELYLAADYEADKEIYVSTIAMAAAWEDFELGWPSGLKGSKSITIKDAFYIAAHLLAGELVLRQCPSCASPILGAGSPLPNGKSMAVLSECVQCHLLRASQRRGKASNDH